MKKRKGRGVGDEEIPPKKSKISVFSEGKENNNKPSDLVRTVKGLLQKEQTRLSGLTKLLNALKESQNKETVDDIIKEAGEFQEVFKILESGRHNLSQLEIQKCLEILESVLLFTAEDVRISTRTGMVIVQRVLHSHMKILYTCLNPGNPPDVIKASLRLLTAMVTQGVSAAREVQRSFDFTLKAIGSLPNKRDTKSAQDVRTCFIYFCLSFLMFGDLAVMKQILELKGFLQSVMKGLQFDPPNMVHAVLSTLQTRVVQNAGITKKTKVQFFNSYVLSQLATLYQYSKDVEEESPQTVRQQVHELLLKICGSFKFGICFSNATGAFATRSNNPVLLRFLQNLSSVTSDVCIQELVTKVLGCCQDVLKPFLSSLSATYEPRLSMPWVANMNLVTKIYMALPKPSHMVQKSGLKMAVELLPSLINMVIPVGISRAVLNRGVQHASSLVEHAILSLLVVILERAQNAAGCLVSKGSSTINLENINAQAETALLQQFREEVLKGLPDVKTLISLRQNLAAGNTKEESQEDAASPTILLAQCLKVILGFQTLWPSVLSHINFDLKKLLPGQQEMNFPPITQQLTLQILLQAPAGSLKWYQQKGKSPMSFVYSILSLYASARSENIKTNAKRLLWKLLRETGLVSNGASEVDIWLGQLQQSQMYKGHEGTLLRFVDEVFTAVATEPHVYTDIVIDMQAEAVATEAAVAQYGVDAEWSMSSDTSLPISLLLVGALKCYTEMVCEINEPVEKTALRNIGCIARYMNCVIFNMIHCSTNPTMLSFVVCHYYGNTVIPKHLMAIRSLHKAVLQYVRCWLPGANQDKLGYFEEQIQRNDEHFNKLQIFLKKTVVNSDQAKVTASAELYHLLEPLNAVQFSAAFVDCVEFCEHKLSADFAPLVEVLLVKSYKITGVASTESISPLLQALPFNALMWQVFGESIQDDRSSLHEIQEDRSSFDDDISSPAPSSWMQCLLMATLGKEPASKGILHCRHLLLYLHSLKTKLTIVCDSLEQGRLQSAIQLCFQLLQYLIQRFVLQLQDLKEGEANLLEEKTTGCLSITSNSSHGTCDVEDLCHQVLHHPVILNCFLWKSEQSMASTICKNVSVQLTYNISNVFLVLLPGLSRQQKHTLMGPFIQKLCNAGRIEIQSAQEGHAGSSSQALYLLGLFRDFCDDENRAHFISSLSELPANMLMRTDSESGEAVPSVFLVALLTLLDFESCSEDSFSNSSSAFLRSVELKTEEPLAVAHFKQLIKISEDFNCPQLDTAVLRLLQKSLMYVLASTTTLLDSCLDHPTEAKIAVAAHLVAHSPALRSHFELRCLGRPSSKKIKLSVKTSPLEFKDHLKEFLPLVSSYVFCVHGMERDTSGETRAEAVISRVVEVYWTLLWEWLFSDREGIFKSSEERCFELLVALIQSIKRDDVLRKSFNHLLSKASLWDMGRFRICYQLLTRLCQEYSTSEEKTDVTRKFCFACMEFLSSVLEEKGDKNDNEDEFQDALAHLELICKESSQLSANNDNCVSTWNSFITNALRFKFKSAHVLRTLSCIIQALYKEKAGALLPLDTLYEMMLSHSQFLEVILDDQEAGKRDLKESLTELMVTIVEKCPACCQSSHLPVLFAAYSASLSTTDQSILYLLNLYETNHTSFKNYRPIVWGPAAASHHQIAKSLGPSLWQQPSVTEVLEQLDASKMNQSAVSFPQNRHLQPKVQRELSDRKLQDVYDPCFLLPLFSCLLLPNYQVDCRKFVEQGCLSFTITSLSSRDTHVRQAGYHVLSRFMMHLEGARFKERKQIFHLLKCLKNGITEANCRISSVMVCFLARVVFILLKPEHPFYIMMNSCLLQRPALDLRDLPLFYSMFNSSTLQHKSERSWMLQLLVDGMKDSPDYYLYKRRHVIELALSYHDSPVSDQHSQNLVAQLLLSAVKIHPAAYDLAKNYGVIAWIHSLCYKSPEKVDTSLNLLYTLWFTLYRGHVGKRTEAANNKGGKDIDDEERAVRMPPNVAQECALVCWTLLEQLGSHPGARDTCSFIELLASITSHLTTNKQHSGLSRDRTLSLLHLWCAVFDETCALNQLLSSLNLKEICRTDVPPCTDGDYSNLKTISLSSLLSILTTWEPSSSTGANQTILLVWRFGLLCSNASSMHNTLANYRLQSTESQTPVPLLSLLRWFRKCLVRNRALQDRLVTESPALEIKAILRLYQVGLSSERTALLKHSEDRGFRTKFCFAVIRELNMICLVLFAAVRRIQQESDRLSSHRTGVFQLISQEPYADCITNGLEKGILPMFSDPSKDLEEAIIQDQDIVLQELVCLFMHELWMTKPIPHQFLSFILSHSGYPVVDSIILGLGGTKVITKWTEKQTV